MEASARVRRIGWRKGAWKSAVTISIDQLHNQDRSMIPRSMGRWKLSSGQAKPKVPSIRSIHFTLFDRARYRQKKYWNKFRDYLHTYRWFIWSHQLVFICKCLERGLTFITEVKRSAWFPSHVFVEFTSKICHPHYLPNPLYIDLLPPLHSHQLIHTA